MRWRFNGDTCCSCGGSGFNCCVNAVLTFRDVNYVDSLVFRRQDSGGTWYDQEMVYHPIEFFASDVDFDPAGETPVDIFSPCAGSQCKYDGPTFIEIGSGSWETTAGFGQWDEFLVPPGNLHFGRETGFIMNGELEALLPNSTIGSQCGPNKRLTIFAANPNDSRYWKRQLPPNIPAYLSSLTWDVYFGHTTDGGNETITFRFPPYVNYCWPARGGASGVSYCNFADATFSNGVYFASGSGANQSGSQTWTYSGSPDHENYLEIPFGGNTLQFRPSTVTGEEDILYMHLNGGFFFAEKFSVAGTCDGSVTWTSLNNPSNYITFDITGGDSCNECGEQTPVVTGCCTLSDGTVDAYSNSAACTAAGGTYSGDGSACPPTGCCQISGSSDLSGVTEAYCTTQGGTWTQGVECGTGWCIDNTAGQVTEGIEEDECSGTWSATEPTVGCCDISGTEYPDVAQSWCTSQSGTFTAGDCPTPPLGWCVNDSTGAITANVLEDDCSGTWSATEPTSGCCTISGTNHPDVAQSWCTDQSGTFVAGSCPPSTFDPCGETFQIAVNLVTLDMDDPNFQCNSPFNLSAPNWLRGSADVDKDACSTQGVKAYTIGSSNEVYGDETNDPSALNQIATYLTVKYNSGPGTWTVTMVLSYQYGSTQTITASKSGISGSGFDCPSFTLSGSFDTFSGTYTTTCSGSQKDVNDMIGSFNITLTCE